MHQILHATPLPVTLAILPSGRTVEVSTMLRQEQVWSGPAPASYGVPNKPALQFDGAPTWPEFVILRLLERDGWSGVWVKNWGGRAFWRDAGQRIELLAAARALFDRIETRIGGHGGGCWDVFAWRGDQFLFIESKQSGGRDRLRATQLQWLESALTENIPLTSFAIVEYLRGTP